MATRVKICGVGRVEEALVALGLGADLLGLNFYGPSKRYLSEEAARHLVAETVAAHDGPLRVPTWVGVVVNMPVDEAVAMGQRVGLDLLQFHGDETPEELAPVAARSIKALRVKDTISVDVLAPWLDLGFWGLLIDAHHPSLYGGSGRSWDFSSLASLGAAAKSTRLLIAGGLSPHNVASAIRTARPWGIDLCSGVERQHPHDPQKRPEKDTELMRQLFEEIHHG